MMQAPTKKAKGPRNGVKIAYMFLLWLFLAGIVLQVTLIGLGLFYQSTYLGAHAGLGWMLAHMFGPIALIVGFFARLGRTLIIVNIVTLVLVLVLPVLATMRDSVVGGLHPLTALAVFALSFYLAMKVRAKIPTPWGSAVATTPAAPAPARQAPAPVSTQRMAPR